MCTNQTISITTLSRRVLTHGKASKCQSSTPTTSFDNAVREPTHDGLPLKFNRLGATRMTHLSVAALDKGGAIPSLGPLTAHPCATPTSDPRLDLNHSCSPECSNTYGLISKYSCILLSSLIILFACCSALSAAPGDIQYTREGGDPEKLKSFPPSIFPHWIHRINYRCDACHNTLFEMKTGTTTINKDLMKEGKVCATCHNGTEAFDDDFANCNRCHLIKEK